ncbi:hypothetical protein D5R81_14380 [Parashewanella spongiae]|uniref:Uncharacterized protein n=1 Tax=Parashewanella spongiae TaxID=342950 RepID=A0A3A6U0N4_9GAMM|nr:ankyrin repeat domain-containing protein [Parashewanella spongiae]MCL1078364.1 ankyrin repeat domain-containing protein [Parashewanella spongiae]RJY10583.1 hypothetical protein D5R81_14380 [Parashewanella spongiae]
MAAENVAINTPYVSNSFIAKEVVSEQPYVKQLKKWTQESTAKISVRLDCVVRNTDTAPSVKNNLMDKLTFLNNSLVFEVETADINSGYIAQLIAISRLMNSAVISNEQLLQIFKQLNDISEITVESRVDRVEKIFESLAFADAGIFKYVVFARKQLASEVSISLMKPQNQITQTLISVEGKKWCGDMLGYSTSEQRVNLGITDILDEPTLKRIKSSAMIWCSNSRVTASLAQYCCLKLFQISTAHNFSVKTLTPDELSECKAISKITGLKISGITKILNCNGLKNKETKIAEFLHQQIAKNFDEILNRQLPYKYRHSTEETSPVFAHIGEMVLVDPQMSLINCLDETVELNDKLSLNVLKFEKLLMLKPKLQAAFVCQLIRRTIDFDALIDFKMDFDNYFYKAELSIEQECVIECVEHTLTVQVASLGYREEFQEQYELKLLETLKKQEHRPLRYLKSDNSATIVRKEMSEFDATMPSVIKAVESDALDEFKTLFGQGGVKDTKVAQLNLLQLACVSSSVKIVEWLLKNTHLDSLTENKSNLLHIACGYSNAETLEIVLKYKNDEKLYDKNANGQTPLTCAIARGELKILRVLVGREYVMLASKQSVRNHPQTIAQQVNPQIVKPLSELLPKGLAEMTRSRPFWSWPFSFGGRPLISGMV